MIRVLRSGIYTTVQDIGRFGYSKFGVPLAGSMDQFSASQANSILGNDPNSAVIEILIKGPQLLFEVSSWICLSGSSIDATCNEKRIPMNMPYFVKTNQLVDFGVITKGRYSYMAVLGGILSSEVMKSRSQSSGITAATTIQKGSVLNCQSGFETDNFEVNSREPLTYNDQSLLVNKGPEFDSLPAAIQRALLSNSFEISNESSRMGYRLESSEELRANEIITSAVQPGTVQMTPSGRLIVLMRDAQTTGGYARVLQLTPESINLLAQKNVGETISFELRS